MKARQNRQYILGLILLLSITACRSSATSTESALLWGAPNFRDVGGYTTSDGRQVKSGVLYRSDDLADLDSSDLEKFGKLGIRRVFDLRHDSERYGNPNRLPAQNNVKVVEIPVFYPPLDRRESRRKILSAEVENGHFRQLLIEANRAFALKFTPQWSDLMHDLIAPGSLPALVHCADGKDRTGFFIAVVLRALGVQQETVMKDFLLSNEQLESRIKRLSFLAFIGSMFRVSQSEIRPLMEVRQEYLEAAFAAIDEEYGSFDIYLEEALGLDAESLAQLRLALLE
jgi:protein-tyrosine phosphatase